MHDFRLFCTGRCVCIRKSTALFCFCSFFGFNLMPITYGRKPFRACLQDERSFSLKVTKNYWNFQTGRDKIKAENERVEPDVFCRLRLAWRLFLAYNLSSENQRVYMLQCFERLQRIGFKYKQVGFSSFGHTA